MAIEMTTKKSHSVRMQEAEAALKALVGRREQDTDDWTLDASATLGFELERKVMNAASRRRLIEERWMEDWLQYQGRYDVATLNRIQQKGDPQVFMNLTRPKCQVLVSRLWDVLFPTDLPNWDVRPSPIPDLSPEAFQRVLDRARQVLMEQQGGQDAVGDQPPGGPDEGVGGGGGADAEGVPVPPPVDEMGAVPGDVSGGAELTDEEVFANTPTDDLYRMVLDEAKAQAARLRAYMKDVLDVGGYGDQAMAVIEDAVQFGSGVMKGPVRGMGSGLRWVRHGEGSRVRWEPRPASVNNPLFRRVVPWDYFPDPEATCMEDCEYVFELHRLNSAQMRQYAQMYEFDPVQTNRLLQDEYPSHGTMYSDFIHALNDIEQSNTQATQGRFYVWEYRGPLPRSVLQTLAEKNPKIARDFGFDADGEESETVLQKDLSVVVWLCEAVILAVGPNALESGELPYSVFSLDPQRTSILGGHGIPSTLRDPQRALNGAWRALLSGSALSARPMVILDNTVSPADGGPRTVSAGRVWERSRAPATTGFPGIEPVLMQGDLNGIMATLEKAEAKMDDEAMIPPLSYGQPGVQAGQTAHGMVLTSNAVNVTFRKHVKGFDGDVSVRSLRRLHEWLMLYGEDEDAKCDVDIVARGTSVLLVREVQAGQRMMAMNMVGSNPAIADAVDMFNLARSAFEAMQLPVDELMRSREAFELQAQARQQAEMAQLEQAGQAPEVEDKAELERIKAESKMQIEQLKQQTAVAQLQMQKAIAELNAISSMEQKKLDVSAKVKTAQMEGLLRRTTGAGI